jgi:hypothetical protein
MHFLGRLLFYLVCVQTTMVLGVDMVLHENCQE